MRTKTSSTHNASILILAVTTVSLLIGNISSFGQDKKLNPNVASFDDG